MEPAGLIFPPNIDPGEAILAVIGVRPLLTKEIERIRAPQWREVANLEREVRRLAKALVNGGLDRPTAYPEIDYEATLKAFSAPPEPAQIMAMLADIPAEGDLPFMTASARAYNLLRGEYPICVERTVFGAVQLEPGDFVLGEFEDLLAIVDRPLSVFGAIESGRLTTKMAAFLQSVYPSLYSEIVVQVVLAVMDAKAEKASTDLDFERGMSVLLGVPGIDPNLRDQLAALPPPEPPPEQRRMEAAKSRRAQLIATKSDRLELEE